MASKVAMITFSILFALLVCSSSSQHLDPGFYNKTCPRLFEVVRDVVMDAINTEKRMGASLLRLHFHDCFVNGCDGSILLDDTTNAPGEKHASPNNNSIRGFEVVDAIKAAVEKICPGNVSCADILAIAARDSVDILGGCRYEVELGRRDSFTASITVANNGTIPKPASNLTTLITLFDNQGLSKKDLVALSGSHTIGRARCTVFRDRIYNDSNINSGFANASQKHCPRTAGSDDNNTQGLDDTQTTFDNTYFKDLIEQKGLLHSDQELYNRTRKEKIDEFVLHFAKNENAFMKAFAHAMIKMGNINVLTGNDQGEIRKKCSVRNS